MNTVYFIVSRESETAIAIFNLKGLSRKRFYRRYLDETDKSFVLCTYKRFSRAVDICNLMNEHYNQNFKVEEKEINNAN